MNRPTALAFLTLTVLTLLAGAEVLNRRATITGSRGDQGKCTIEVEVDGAAEVEVSGDTGRLRTLAGQTSTWRRLECSGPLPRNPNDFRFRGIDGRGRVELVRDPRSGGGVAVVRIEDREGGREGYTFDLEWRGTSGGGSGGRFEGGRGGRGDGDRSNLTRALRVCQEAVVTRLERDGYRNVNFASVNADDRPGRNDWIVGTAHGRRGSGNDRFEFGCSVDFSTGRVRSVDVNRR